MAISIVSAILDVLTPDIVSKIAAASGLNRSMAQKAVTAAVPAILSRLADAADEPDGARKLTDAIAKQPADASDSIASSLTSPTQLATNGNSILSSLVGSSATNLLASTVARFLGISGGEMQMVVGLVMPLILSTLGRIQRGSGLDATELADLLTVQKQEISDAMPTGFPRFLETPELRGNTDNPIRRIPRAYERHNPPSGASGPKPTADRRAGWTYWALTLAAVGGLLWALLPGGSGTNEPTIASSGAPPASMLVPSPDRKPIYLARAAENWRSIGATPNDYVNQYVYNAAGENIGTVRDLLIRPDGTAAAAVISVGLHLGIGDKEVAVPFSMLRMERRESGRRIVVDVLKDALQSAPSYEHVEQKR